MTPTEFLDNLTARHPEMLAGVFPCSLAFIESIVRRCHNEFVGAERERVAELERVKGRVYEEIGL